jgi:hypothetical protein
MAPWPACALLLAAFVPAPAAAQDEDKKKAKELFNEGVALFKSEQHAKALENFQKSYELRPHWLLHLNIGLCYKELNMFTEAKAEFQAFLEEGGDSIDKDSLKQVNSELASLKGIIAVLVIDVLTEGARVELDGRDIGEQARAGPVEVNPGKHVLKATLEGHGPFEKEFLASKGERETFHIALVPVEQDADASAGEGAAGPEPVEAGKARASGKGKTGKSAAFWALGGVTLALAATAAVTGGLAVHKHAQVEDLDRQVVDIYESSGWSEDVEQDYLGKRGPLVDDGKLLGVLTTGFMIAAGAALAGTVVAGILTHPFSPAGKDEDGLSLQLVPATVEHGCMVVVAGTF